MDMHDLEQLNEIRRLVLQASPIQVGADLKGFLLKKNDFVSLLSTLTEWTSSNE